MKSKPVLTLLIAGAIGLLIYSIVVHDFVTFFFGGKTEMLEVGEHINKLCNADGACPTTIEGWQKSGLGIHWVKGNMHYFVGQGEEEKAVSSKQINQTFRLVYSFFMPDDWYEVQGGVGRKVTSGWSGR